MIYDIDSFPGREITFNGKKYLYFGGTSYLGLQTDLGFQELFIQHIKKYGTNYGASRKSNVRISVFEKAEKKLADLVGSEVCTTLSSGYLAGQLVARTFSNPIYKAFYAPNAHSALYQKKTERFDSFEALNAAVRSHIKSAEETIPIIFMDSIDFSGDGYPAYKQLQLLPLNELILVVDDSHGIGVVGENGSGVYQNLKKLSPKELIVCCSLGKGFGIQVGAIFGTHHRIAQLTETDFFGGASPASPAAMGTFLDATYLYSDKRKSLEKNNALFKKLILHPQKMTSIPHHPAFSFSDSILVEYLEENGIIITNFNYPNEEALLMSRIVISAHHTPADIRYLANALNSYKE